MLPFVPSFIPDIVQVLPVVVAFSILFARWIRTYPGLFYAVFACLTALETLPRLISSIPVSIDVLKGVSMAVESAVSASDPLSILLDLTVSSYAGVAFYLVVMFIGALERTAPVKRLLSIRSELSVIGGIVVMGHLLRVAWMPFMYAIPGFADSWGEASMGWMFAAIAVVGPLLSVCFLVPWITSFRFVRERLGHKRWKRTQLLAYPFMAMMVLQGFFLAVGHALSCVPADSSEIPFAFVADPAAWLSSFAGYVATAAFYAFIGVAYLGLRAQRKSLAAERRKAVKEFLATEQA